MGDDFYEWQLGHAFVLVEVTMWHRYNLTIM